ncbi:hypothetical protein T01_847 [Trichinella spiralis]|uniref:Uncharacterized protein n=1 Tax=Trichinella spiralis TaxID=6334 RepID=A0A0V1B9B4_TRISP|nr:hypothetical protein T01_847 [Trichinella spiralis]
MDSKAICLFMAFSVLFPKSTSGFVWELYKAKNSTDNQNYEIVSKSAFGFIIPIVVVFLILLNLAVIFHFPCNVLFQYSKTLCKRLCKSCHHEDEETLLDFVDEAFLI